MKKLVMILMVCCMPMMMMAQSAKYCMTYSDYKVNKWNLVDNLVGGRGISWIISLEVVRRRCPGLRWMRQTSK